MVALGEGAVSYEQGTPVTMNTKNPEPRTLKKLRAFSPQVAPCPYFIPIERLHTEEYDPFIQSQLARRNQLSGLMWCKFGHVTFKISN